MNSSTIRRIINTLLGLGLLGLGGAAGIWLAVHKVQPERKIAKPQIPAVDIEAVQQTTFEAPIVGYGTVRPKRLIKIVPQVSGRLVEVHEDLAVGNFIAKGELLFKIDDRQYKARIKQVRSEIKRLESQLARHKQEKQTLQKRLGLAERMLELARENLEREKGLVSEDASTGIAKEQAEQQKLQQEEAVLGYRNKLDLIPNMIAETKSLLEMKRAQLEEAELALEHTKIYCPCDVRVNTVGAQESQVVVASLQIATLTDMEALELPVTVDPRELRWTDRRIFARAIGKELKNPPEARVTWTMFGKEYSLTGRVVRLEKMDASTRTAHMVVEIRDVLAQVKSESGRTQPPLSVGMFCKAQLPTEPLEKALVVPRHAIREGKYVYTYEPDSENPETGSLVIKRVPMLRTIGEDVLVSFARKDVPTTMPYEEKDGVECELTEGDRLIISPLPKAVEGMKLQLKNNGVITAAKHTKKRTLLADARRKPAEQAIIPSHSGVR
jgi:multidrug efflux pump subunit AcrA (membrane-fusion protein)